MRVFLVLVLLVFGLFSLVFARQISIENIAEYDSRSATFTVKQDFEVGEDDILVIPAGSRVQFMPLVGINVKGELAIVGQPDRQVILTSQRGVQGFGAPYDWRGITLFQTAKAKIDYAVISFASFGIRTCCDNVTLTNVVFLSNGVNFQVGNRRLHIPDRDPISYEVTLPSINVGHNPLKTDYDAIAGKRYVPALTYVLSPIVVALGIVGPVYLFKWGAHAREYNEFGPNDSRFADAKEREETFKRMRNRVLFDASFGIGLTALGLGLGGYTIYYTWRF